TKLCDALCCPAREAIRVSQRQVHFDELVVQTRGLLCRGYGPGRPRVIPRVAVHLQRGVRDATVGEGKTGVLGQSLLVQPDGGLDVLRVLLSSHRVAALEVELVRFEVLGW